MILCAATWETHRVHQPSVAEAQTQANCYFVVTVLESDSQYLIKKINCVRERCVVWIGQNILTHLFLLENCSLVKLLIGFQKF
jgi:hypothetical protein